MRQRSIPHSFAENFATRKSALEDAMNEIPPGPERDEIPQKIRAIENVQDADGWLRSEPKEDNQQVRLGVELLAAADCHLGLTHDALVLAVERAL